MEIPEGVVNIGDEFSPPKWLGPGSSTLQTLTMLLHLLRKKKLEEQNYKICPGVIDVLASPHGK